MPRLACLYVPLFPLAARLRSEPDLMTDAVAIVEGNGSNGHIIAATRRARIKGIRPGQSVPQARSLVPKLIVRARDRECERTAQEALVEAAETFSPRIEDAEGGLVFFDVTGLERHFPNERALAAAAIQTADSMALPARCGIAASKLAARVAAELPHSPTVVEPGKEIDFLAPLPIERLSPEIDAATTIARWGLASIGDFAKLPESEVAARLGELGRELHHAAHGIDPRPLIPRALPPEFREGMELEWPLVALDAFLFIANAALDRLTKRMEMQGFACRRLELTLMLDPDGFHSRAIELPAPTRDVRTMLTLLRLDLEKTPPGAPVAGFSIVAHPDRPRRAQLSLFGPTAVSPEKLATAIARLISLLGEDRVGAPQTVDGHLSDRFAIGPFSPPPPPDMRPQARPVRACAAVRVFRPPIPVEVTMRGDTIESIRSDSEVNGPVRAASGPWQAEEGWWRPHPDVREYWEVELHGGQVYRMYRDGGWMVEGAYD
jgi:protein ImuB